MSSGIWSSHVRETDLHAWRCVNANKNSEKRGIYPGNSWFYRRVKWESRNKISFISMVTLLRDIPGFREFRSQKLNSYAQREPDGRSAELTEEEKLNLHEPWPKPGDGTHPLGGGEINFICDQCLYPYLRFSYSERKAVFTAEWDIGFLPTLRSWKTSFVSEIPCVLFLFREGS